MDAGGPPLRGRPATSRAASRAFSWRRLHPPRTATWPPSLGDLEEAEAPCRQLGLGDLLARMPSGLMQRVGDMGWQLSHGERSRLFLARALLQGADVVVLDESFAALDPDTLRLSVECATRRAPALLVVAHP